MYSNQGLNLVSIDKECIRTFVSILTKLFLFLIVINLRSSILALGFDKNFKYSAALVCDTCLSKPYSGIRASLCIYID